MTCRLLLTMAFILTLGGCQGTNADQDVTVEVPAHYLHLTRDAAKLQRMCGAVMGHLGGCELELTATSASNPQPRVIARDIWLLSGRDCVAVHEAFHAAGWSHARMDAEQPWLTSCNF